MTQERTIKSRWVVKKVIWDDEQGKFVNREEIEFFKPLKMSINGDILTFYGGPTGFERYCIKDLVSSCLTGDEMCICAGTVNSCPACYVSLDEMYNFLRSNGWDC